MSSTGFSTRTEKIPLPREIRVKEERNLHRYVKLLLLFFVLEEKTHKNVPGTEEKVELFLAGIGEKKVAFPFTDSNAEFIETMWKN